MKKTIKIFALIVGFSFFFTGCYTIVWDPREEYPNTENYTESSGFYETDYYGGYGNYYDTPWWITVPVFVTYPGGTDNSQTKDRNNGRTSGTENMRNNGGRGNTDRNPVITNTTPTTTTTNTTTSSGNSDIKDTPPPTRDTNPNNSGSTSSSDSKSSSSGNNSGTRNSSGSRNSGNGRK